ncbi:GTP-binding protein, partial [Micromonospora zhanjiangensis]
GSPANPVDGGVDRTPVPLDQVAARIAGRGGRPGGPATHVEIGVPRELLNAGLVLVDTPGTDAAGTPGGTAVPEATTVRADTVLLVSDSTRELSVGELNLLLHVMQSHSNVVVVQTKTDLVPDWRTVADRNRGHLAGAGIPAALICVSAALRLRAAATDDRALNAESGFPDVLARLRRDVTGKADTLARSAVALIVRNVVEQLAAPLRAELSDQDAGEQSAPMSRLRAAQREVDELRRCTARWQNMLGDEMADLISDVEYDLRDRTRRILKVVDEAFDTADPLTGWDDFQRWLEQSLIEATRDNRRWFAQRCDWTARRVADNFARYGRDALPGWSPARLAESADELPVLDRPTIDKFSASHKLITGMKGSYGGVLMFGLATTLAGMPMINVVSVGAGAVFGGKSVWDESRSLLRRRQSMVKTAVQRYVDDYFVRVTKEVRDTARQVQRTLRDHFAASTEQLQEAIVQSFRTAKQEADADAAIREQRQREIQQKMARLAAVYEQAQRLGMPRGAAPGLATKL